MELDREIAAIESEKIEIEIQKQQKQEYKLMGRMRLIPGLILYQFNWGKMELTQAIVQKSDAIDIRTQQPTEKCKVIADPKSYYFQAHSHRAAVKKINKLIKKVQGIDNYFKMP